MNNQKGFAPILIVILIALILGAFFIYRTYLYCPTGSFRIIWGYPCQGTGIVFPSPSPVASSVASDSAVTKANIDKQIINIIAAKFNINPANIKVGTPRTENDDWIAVNVGVTGSGAIYIFQKNGTELELVYYGQECPSKELITAKKIPSEILVALNSSGCK